MQGGEPLDMELAFGNVLCARECGVELAFGNVLCDTERGVGLGALIQCAAKR